MLVYCSGDGGSRFESISRFIARLTTVFRVFKSVICTAKVNIDQQINNQFRIP
jgi:hypothetical protein